MIPLRTIADSDHMSFGIKTLLEAHDTSDSLPAYFVDNNAYGDTVTLCTRDAFGGFRQIGVTRKGRVAWLESALGICQKTHFGSGS